LLRLNLGITLGKTLIINNIFNIGHEKYLFLVKKEVRWSSKFDIESKIWYLIYLISYIYQKALARTFNTTTKKLVNSQLKNINSNGDLVFKKGFWTFVSMISDIRK
jgi:hypothetical protein